VGFGLVSERVAATDEYTRKAILKKAVSGCIECTSETNLFARLAIHYGPPSAICGQERQRVLGQLEDINLQPRELMPQLRRHLGRKRREL